MKTSYFDHEPEKDEMAVITSGMLAYHSENGHERKEDVFSILQKDDHDILIAAIICSVLWGRMSIKTLWVDTSRRRNGLGRKLIQLAENEAIKRGCTHAYTDTFSYQAPEFYKKLGYVEFAIMPNFPPGSSLHYLLKTLI